MDIKKLGQSIAEIATPFATVGTALFAILALLEVARRGSVSLFLDLRVVILVVLVFWIIASLASVDERRTRQTVAIVLFSLVVVSACLYKYVLPFGRLGLLTLMLGILSATIVFLTIIRHSSYD